MPKQSFEMDGISINGIPLNLNIEVDDEELMGQVTELLDAISQLDDGAAELQDGASDLQDGAQSDLKSGVNDLKDGAEQLHRGAADMKTDDMLYSGGNGTGLSFYIKYAEGSTEDNPTVIAKGVDGNGNEFEQTIHINKINPKCATVVEMRVLEAHLGVDKNGGLSSLPLETGEMGLHDRADFMDMFQKQISDMRLLGQQKLAAYYQYSMQAYWDFMNKK